MTGHLISVIMPTYNHAAFVGEAIDSVLRQRDVDIEFLVGDDGSTDGTREVVAAVQDDRLRFFPNEVNRGACLVTNQLVEQAAGEFVALINSDDVWIGDEKLASQLRILEDDPDLGACFGRARFIDKDGEPVSKSALPNGRVFDQENRSRGAWLRRFFDVGNCLCHPTMLIRRSCYAATGPYDNRLRQLPDFDLWVRLLKRFDIHVMDRDLIAFRQLPGENASAVTAENSQRAISEMYFILRGFFDGMPRDVLRDGFGDLLDNAEVPDDAHADIEQALLFGRKNGNATHIHALIALEKLHTLLGSAVHAEILRDEYGIDDRRFQTMAGEPGVLDEPLALLEKELADARARVAYLDESLHTVEQSASWRVTAPMRRLMRATRRSR